MDLSGKILKALIVLGVIGILAYSAGSYWNWKDYKAQQVVVPVEGKILFTSIGRDAKDATFLLDDGEVRGLSEAGAGKFLPEDKYITFWQGNFRVWSIKGEPIKTIGLPAEYKPFQFDVSPDGKTIVFTSTMGKSFAPYNLYSISINGSKLKQLTDFTVNTDWPIGDPAISPDGKKVAFDAPKHPDEESFPVSLYVMNIDGTGQEEIFGDSFVGGAEPAWSPNMKEIAFVSGEDNFRNLFKVDLSTMEVTQLTHFDKENYGHVYDPCYSPDGKQICFALKLRGVTAGQEIFAVNASDGSDTIRLTPAKRIRAYPGWATDKYPDWH